jgi:hypothetical protein
MALRIQRFSFGSIKMDKRGLKREEKNKTQLKPKFPPSPPLVPNFLPV